MSLVFYHLTKAQPSKSEVSRLFFLVQYEIMNGNFLIASVLAICIKIVLFPFTIFSKEKEVDVVIRDIQTKNIVDVPKRVLPVWEINEEGVFEFYWVVTFKPERVREIVAIQAQKSVVAFGEKQEKRDSKLGKKVNSRDSELPEQEFSQRVAIKMRSTNDKISIQYSDRSSKSLELELKLPEFMYYSEGCAKYSLEIIPVDREKIKSPGYLAYRCEPTDTGLTLAVSAPVELSWQSSTLFETKGKGKRWRSFELNLQVPKSQRNEVGRLTFAYPNQVDYDFSIIIDAVEVARKINQFRFALGVMNMNFNSQGDSVSMPKLGTHVGFDLRPWSARWGFGGIGLASIPTLGTSQFFTHIGAAGYAGYLAWVGESLLFEPRFYVYLAEGVNEKTQAFYSLSIPGIGFFTKWDWLKNWTTSFELMLGAGGGSQGIAQWALYLGRSSESRSSWGLSLFGNSLQAGKTDLPVRAEHLMFGVYFDF